MNTPEKYAVIGAGHGGKAMAAHLALLGLQVNLYNRTFEHIDVIRKRGGIDLDGPDPSLKGFAKLKIVTADMREAIEGIQMIMVVVPSSAHIDIAKAAAPHLKTGQTVILHPGRTCGALEFAKILRDEGCRADVTIAEAETFIYASRSDGPAQARIFRIKEAVPLAALPANRTDCVLESICYAYPQYIDGINVLHTGLNNMGAIFHPALTILNTGWIEHTHGDYQFYIDGVTPSVARVLEVLDRERVTVASSLGIRARTAQEWLKLAYDTVGADLHEAIHNQPGYYGIKAPPTLNHRYIFEDVPMSLVPIASIGMRFGVSVRGMESIIRLGSIIHRTDFWRRGRTVERLGLDQWSVSELTRYVEEGVIEQEEPMCGIAGVFYGQSHEEVRGMLYKLRHRGPDGEGIQSLPSGTLGHRRLAIIDVEGGHQPMNVGDAWIVFNGEIYNFRELVQEHLADQTLNTQSDTEVLLRLYLKYGPKCVELLRGMFTFAILNREELFLARDPLGIKPLYCGNGKNGFYFASEIKALAVATSEIHEFPAGHWYHSTKGWKAYYEVAPASLELKTEEDAMEEIRTTVQDAVCLRMIADVPVGVSLSGGLDSSIVAMLTNKETKHLHSFAVGMDGSEDLKAARKMADLLGTQHHERIYTEEEMLSILPQVIYHLESFDPALVRSAIPNWFLAELASKYVKVILTGEGADEIYAGYDYLSSYHEPQQLQEEMVGITSELHNTNLQRADRIPMAFGLEARVPFLDVKSVGLGLGMPPEWKFHKDRPAKYLLRQAFACDLPEEIVNRPKQKFSVGAGSSTVFASRAERQLSDAEFQSEFNRLLSRWDYEMPNKEALLYYRVLRQYFDDRWIFPSMGQSRSL